MRSRPSTGASAQRAERVRGEQDEKIEGRGDPGLHRSTLAFRRRRQIAAEQRDQRAEQRQDQHPQQHRAFVVAPDAGELVDQRHRRMRILERRWRPRNRRRRSRPISAAKDSATKTNCASAVGAATPISVASLHARADQRHGRLDQARAPAPAPARNGRVSGIIGCLAPFAVPAPFS